MSPYLFAYGFLKRKFHGSEATQTPKMDVEFISTGTLPGEIYLVEAYPGVIYNPDSNILVKGEIFKMKEPSRMLQILDKYENALPLITQDPDYKRQLRSVETDLASVDCWVYEYLKPVNTKSQIMSGEF